MRVRLTSMLLCFLTFAGNTRAELYLITGAPNPKGGDPYMSVLLSVNADGTVRSVAELIPKGVSSELITVSYDWRKAFIDSYEHGGTLSVVDFDKAAVTKKCRNPGTPGMGERIERWLANSPAIGPAYEGSSWDPPKPSVVEAMSLDSSVPCSKSFAVVGPSDMRYLEAHGQAGIAGLIPQDGAYAGIVDGRLMAAVDMGYEVPAELRKGLEKLAAGRIVISDSHVLVVRLISTENVRRTLLLRKSDQTWRVLPVPTEYCLIRGFGRYIGIAEVQPSGPRYPRSVGREAWRKGRSPMGPDLNRLFSDYELTRPGVGAIYKPPPPTAVIGVFPGRLYIYDIETEKTYPIVTNQADSEVLLVANGAVYYRITDRIYAADIGADAIGAPREIARAEEVRDAHWAFFKH